MAARPLRPTALVRPIVALQNRLDRFALHLALFAPRDAVDPDHVVQGMAPQGCADMGDVAGDN
ncbi:hypothetical protein C665_03312 [Thauera aminoaromatica S2]|uniref:Uncharacterized protein n=1 Tax=Thauera aminoaromatica S2 TaxID=1234381 RepID=N6Y1G2_THASP|nr:hypothetical protein C665_03312 [Thauera aminoaromatica S2]